MAMTYTPSTRFFFHQSEITHGAARVLYVEPFGQLGCWALPGGAITRDPVEARAAAILIDQLIRANRVDEQVQAARVMAAHARLGAQPPMNAPERYVRGDNKAMTWP